MEAINRKEKVQPPKCIFLPDRGLIRQIIKALIKFRDDTDEIFLLRFCLLE